MTAENISTLVWDLKYRYRLGEQIIDQTIEDTWARVSKALATVEKPAEKAHWEGAFYHILEDYSYLPGGRILAGAGTKHHVTLFNCFVMHLAKDSLAAIFEALKEGALTLQQGGGVGYDFSVLRPSGDPVVQAGTLSSGPVSFMRIWNTTCGILLSTGARRGAMMAVLRVDHPDIEIFIDAKKDPRELRHFNVSVLISDAFMKAVKEDALWPLVFPIENEHEQEEIIEHEWMGVLRLCRVYKRLRARALWEKIIRAAYDYAEPGVLFGDTINRKNNLSYCEYISATNPCGEIPLPSYGACNLGAINLPKFVMNTFTQDAKINWQKLEETVRIATRFQDNVIDLSHYPLPMQKDEAIKTRRIGLGITGLADAFIMLGVRYGSDASIQLAKKIMQCVAETTWRTSIELAKEKGVFPLYEKKYLQSEFVQTLNGDIQHALQKYGVRNSHHNTIAPTGTISLLAHNVSNGIEPVFKAQYERNVRLNNNDIKTFHVEDYAYKLWRESGEENLPKYWVDTEDLNPDDHLAVQAAVQIYIDNAISKTINIPENFSFENLIDVYSKAYTLGLKGCTIFRPNPVTGSVLVAEKCEDKTEGDCCPEE